ncbi:UNVERIFIED_CONTAM: Coilin [Sesamum angustifolium]|uniref:Coilin n=1 Tax=Sesamum angustifolium TaxID=2727405 RepID=A0AAW2Q949_9LAMI
MEESKRIRLVFIDDDILSETQKSHGLSRSWVLLKPHQHASVSDVASHLLHAFQLHQSCPQGLLLSVEEPTFLESMFYVFLLMIFHISWPPKHSEKAEAYVNLNSVKNWLNLPGLVTHAMPISGFVLPPFESTQMLKEDEIVRTDEVQEIGKETDDVKTPKETKKVGKVSWYNAESNQTMLVPVPQYPIVSKSADGDEAAQPDSSLYKEDGSLEIDFSSLIDVRIFNDENSASRNEAICQAKIINVIHSDDIPFIDTTELNQGKETQPPTSVNIWDQISETLNAKKEELSKEKGWGTTPKKVQPSQENSWGKNSKKVQQSPQSGWVKSAQKVQPPQDNSWGKNASIARECFWKNAQKVQHHRTMVTNEVEMRGERAYSSISLLVFAGVPGSKPLSCFCFPFLASAYVKYYILELFVNGHGDLHEMCFSSNDVLTGKLNCYFGHSHSAKFQVGKYICFTKISYSCLFVEEEESKVTPYEI